MITITLFTVSPLILAALPAAAVPQHLWKDDIYCLETTTETVTITQTAADDASSSSTGPEEPLVSAFIETITETTTETVTLTNTLTAAPTVDAGALESIVSPETKINPGPEVETVTVFNTVTDVNTVTIEILQPTRTLDPTSEPESSTSTGSAVPLPLTVQPCYVNSTVGPYGNSSLTFNVSAPVVSAPPLAVPSPSSLSYSGYENGLYFTNWSVPHHFSV